VKLLKMCVWDTFPFQLPPFLGGEGVI
jgi:hypothetical protein